MPDTPGVWASAVVEGDIDEAVLAKLTESLSLGLGSVYGRVGKQYIYARIGAYNKAANFSPWIVLIDLDEDAPCAPTLSARLLPQPSKFMIFRVAVRAVESWLLADRREFAAFIGVNQSQIPTAPDSIIDPKGFVVNLARTSRKPYIRTELVPRVASGKRVGPAYSSRLIEFVLYKWDPLRAEGLSDSLRRCKEGIRKLVEKAQQRADEGG